jgi:hypothetical protein
MFFFGKIVITSSFVVNDGLKSPRPPTLLDLVFRKNCRLDEEASWRIPFRLSAKRTSRFALNRIAFGGKADIGVTED